jgi:MFS family permease
LAALFGHFGDRIGRKVTLVASLLTMGISTVAIGLLPTYETIGILAPVLLALARLVRVWGWVVNGGAALLATENAPARKRCMVLSRSWARRLASSLPTGPSCCSPGC